MEEDLETSTTLGKDLTRAVATKKILANCGDIRCSEASFGLSCGGFSECSLFLPFINRGKRFFDVLCRKVMLPSPTTSRYSIFNHVIRHRQIPIYSMVTRPSNHDPQKLSQHQEVLKWNGPGNCFSSYRCLICSALGGKVRGKAMYHLTQ